MKKIYVIIIVSSLIIISTNLSSQNINNCYYNYYYNIYEAELNICKQDHLSALNYYKKAFSQIENKFYYDLYNAAQCAEIIGYYNDLDTIIKDIYKLGYNWSPSNEIVYYYLDSINDYQLKTNLVNLNRSFNVNLNQEIISQSKKRYDLDQKINNIRINNGSEENYIAFHEVVYDNISWLMSVIDSNGYPNRKILGEETEPFNSPVIIMVVHYLQKKTNKALLPLLKSVDFYRCSEDSIINSLDSIPVLEILANEVKKGNLWIAEYFGYHSFVRNIEKGKYFYNKYYNSNQCPPIFSEKEDSSLIEISKKLLQEINSIDNLNSSFFLGKSVYKFYEIKLEMK